MDARRDGQHGIARFGREVVGRLRTPAMRLGGPRNALSPLDLLNTSRLRLRHSDVVFSPGFHSGPTRARQLLTLHDLIQLEDLRERDSKKVLYYRHVVRPAVLRAGRVLTVSETSRRAVERWLDGAVPVIDVGNGCSDAFFTAEPSGERRGLLYVGAMKAHKNPDPVFAALRLLDVVLTVVTNDADDARRLIAEHGVEDRVRLRTDLSDQDLAALYGTSSALIFPSLTEGFGLPAAESLAMGCPVIHWSGCTAVAEIVEQDGTAVEDAQDPHGWAAAMQLAVDGRLVAQGAARVRARYSWDAVAERVDQQIATL